MTEVYRVGGYDVSDRVLRAVQNASQRTGVDFSYMMAKAAQESAFRPEVKAPTSSATGLYQFIDSTWLGVVKEHGAEHGLGQYADQITRGRNGWTVSDPAMRREILGLRTNPEVSALMAAEFALDNQEHLERTVGGEIGATELYFAHFLGAGGAEKFLNAMHRNPDQSGAALFPNAARANRSIFYDNGGARSLREIYNAFDNRVANGLALAEDVPPGLRVNVVRPGANGGTVEVAVPGQPPAFPDMPRAVFDWLRVQPRVIHPTDTAPEEAPQEQGVRVVRAATNGPGAFDLSLFSVLATSMEVEPGAGPVEARILQP